MTHTNNDAHNAYIALDLLRNPTQGKSPDWTELQAYREGGLSEQRRTEVVSHIANDPEVHQQWLDLAEAESWLANPQNQAAADSAAMGSVSTDSSSMTLRERIGSWFSPGRTALAGVGAMAIAAIAIVPSLVQQTALNTASQFDFSAERYAALAASGTSTAPRVRPTRNIGSVGPLENDQVEKTYVLVGLRSVVQNTVKPETADWGVWLDNTPGDYPDCTKATDTDYCGAVAEDAQMLGQWTMLTWFGCQQQASFPAGDDFWKSQSALWEALRSGGSFSASSGFAKEMTPLGGSGVEGLCERAERVQNLARSTN